LPVEKKEDNIVDHTYVSIQQLESGESSLSIPLSSVLNSSF